MTTLKQLLEADEDLYQALKRERDFDESIEIHAEVRKVEESLRTLKKTIEKMKKFRYSGAGKNYFNEIRQEYIDTYEDWKALKQKLAARRNLIKKQK